MSKKTIESKQAPKKINALVLKKKAVKHWPLAKIQLIKNTVAIGATDDELKLFLYTCARTGLDPLTRQIYAIKRKVKDKKTGQYREQMTIQTGIDGYRAIAEKTGTLAGIDDAVYDSEKEAHPSKATVTVYRTVNGERVSFTASARWSEYAQTGNQAFMWNKMPYLMLAKCAESLALRKAFPNDLSGLYTNDEMAQADNKVLGKKTFEPRKAIDTTNRPVTPDQVSSQEDLIEIIEDAISKLKDPGKVEGLGNKVKASPLYSAETKKTLLPKIKARVNELLAEEEKK